MTLLAPKDRVWMRWHEWVGDTVYEDRVFYTDRKCRKCGWTGRMGRDDPPTECEVGEWVPRDWLPLADQDKEHPGPRPGEVQRLLGHVLGEVNAGRAVVRPEDR